MHHSTRGHSGMEKVQRSETKGNPYLRLLLMAVLSFISMYVLMYAMVDRFENVLANMNQFYMAGLMAAPMVIMEITLMSGMYPDKKLNTALIAVSVLLLAGFFTLIRQQAMIKDKELLRSMIPHHAGAVLMCEQTSLEDPEVQALCRQIIESQQREIDQMKAILERMGE